MVCGRAKARADSREIFTELGMSDSEDEVQDWGVLGSNDAQIMKRGEKDHAPDGTKAQQDTLLQSREAMYGALSKPASSLSKHVVECDWDDELRRGVIRKVKGNYFNTIGWSMKALTCVCPEEIIYLVQRGSMVCFFNNQPLSVEGVMSLTLSHISTNRLQVYSHLKRLGYIVRRPFYPNYPGLPVPTRSLRFSMSWPSTSLVWLILGNHFPKLAWKPFYSKYSSVYRDLQWVKAKPIDYKFELSENKAPFDFYVWKPSSKFKRSAPGTPDFRIRVVSADDSMPCLSDMKQDFRKVKAKKSTKKSAVARMREGSRAFIYAVVDNGVIGFVRAFEPEIESIVQ